MRKLSGKRAELRRYFEEYSVSLYADGATHTVMWGISQANDEGTKFSKRGTLCLFYAIFCVFTGFMQNKGGKT